MALTVVVGGQFGSEGKGKMVSHLVSRNPAEAVVVRCGGSNAGHTAEGNGRRATLRQLPSGAVFDQCRLFLSAGMQLDLEVLQAEIEELGVEPDRLTVDPGAVVIDGKARKLERRHRLLGRVASTMTGTGGAIARKVLRARDLRLARDVHELARYLGDVSAQLSDSISAGHHVIVEGTQGLGLSLHHGEYPFATSRDTTAAAFLSESGLPPTAVTNVVLVLRTYPIRVAGNSGPLRNEITWEILRERSGYPTPLAEYTTVTGRLRRVAEFDWALAKKAVRINQPTALAVHGLDYLNHEDQACRSFASLSSRSKSFVAQLESRLGVQVPYLFTGPDGAAVIDRALENAHRPQRVAGRAAA